MFSLDSIMLFVAENACAASKDFCEDRTRIIKKKTLHVYEKTVNHIHLNLLEIHYAIKIISFVFAKRVTFAINSNLMIPKIIVLLRS